MSPRSRIVNVSEDGGPGWNWLGGRFKEDRFEWQSFSAVARGGIERHIRKPHLGRYRACVQAMAAAHSSQTALLVTHGPLMAAWTGAMYQAARMSFPHLAISFTFSNLPVGRRRQMLASAVRKVDRFVCFSSIERERYANYFNIDIERVDVLRWCVDEPDYDFSSAALESGEYLCAVGGEGRDYATLVEAMRRLPQLRLAIVARPANLQGLDLPENVSVRTNIPLAQVYNIIHHARMSVLPLRDPQVPCGHSTLILSMQLQTPAIVTESAAMVDYVEDGATGLTTAAGDPDAMAEAIQRLWDDRALAERLVTAGRKFATDECSEARTVDYFRDYLRGHGLI